MPFNEVPDWMQRTSMLLGEEALRDLNSKNVLLAGLGGVGGICAEMIARSGVGRMTIIDADIVEASNRNRQIPALIATEGKLKTEVMAERIRQINPDIELTIISEFINIENLNQLVDIRSFDYAADCIDTLTPKVNFIRQCVFGGIPLISSMGAGGRLDPSKVQIADISESHSCKLAYYVRKKLHQSDIRSGFKVVFSPEVIDHSRVITTPKGSTKKSLIGTISFMPAVFGCFVASVVINDLLKQSLKVGS